MTFSLKGLKTITNYQYEPACGILSLLDIWSILAAQRLFKDFGGEKNQDFMIIRCPISWFVYQWCHFTTSKFYGPAREATSRRHFLPFLWQLEVQFQTEMGQNSQKIICIFSTVQTNIESIGWQGLNSKGHWLIIQWVVGNFDGCQRIENNPVTNENTRYSTYLALCFSKCLLHRWAGLILWTSIFYVNLSLNITVIESRSSWKSNK